MTKNPYSYERVQESLHEDIRNETSVKDAIETAAKLWPDKRYLTYAPTSETISFAEMNRRANSVANALKEVGVGLGDRVGVYLKNRPEFITAIYGTTKIGAVETPISWEYRVREVEHTLDTAEISTVLAEDDELIINNLKELATEYDGLEQVLAVDEAAYNELEDVSGIDLYLLQDLMDSVPDTNPNANVGREDPAAIMYTSGTTGLPKPTVIPHRGFNMAAKSFLGVPFSKNDVNYNQFPLFHGNNQFYSMYGQLLAGREYVLSDRFSASNFMDEVVNFGVTSFNILGGTPQMLDSAYDEDDIPEHDLELAIGPMAEEIWEPFEEKFDLTVIQLYSQTESPTLILNAPPGVEKKVGSIGKPMFQDIGHEVELLDENGNKVSVGEEGELTRTDPGAMLEYRDMPEKTEETLKDGVIFSGDIAKRDEDGYLYYIDRKKFMVRRSGENISAQEVENVINEIDGVAECGIIPVPDKIRGEEPKAMVMRQTEYVRPVDIIEHVANELASYKVPRYVEFVDGFPRTPSERIKRVQLAEKEKDRDDHGWDREKEMSEWEDLI